jgi:ribosomal protein L7/L12
MSTEFDLIQLRARVKELEDRLEYIYKHLQIEFIDNPDVANAKVLSLLKAGNKIEAIKVYREIYNVGLAEAKNAVEEMEKRHL